MNLCFLWPGKKEKTAKISFSTIKLFSISTRSEVSGGDGIVDTAGRGSAGNADVSLLTPAGSPGVLGKKADQKKEKKNPRIRNLHDPVLSGSGVLTKSNKEDGVVEEEGALASAGEDTRAVGKEGVGIHGDGEGSTGDEGGGDPIGHNILSGSECEGRKRTHPHRRKRR